MPSGPQYRVSVLNLSLTGLAFRGQQHYRLGEHVLVTLYPKGRAKAADARLTIRGRVAWCAAPGGGSRETVGVLFNARSPHLRRRISAWAAKHKELLL